MASTQETLGIEGFDVSQFDAFVRRGLRPDEVRARLAGVVVHEFGRGNVGGVLQWLGTVAGQHADDHSYLGEIADAVQTALDLGPETLEDLDGVKKLLDLSGLFKAEQPMPGPAA